MRKPTQNVGEVLMQVYVRQLHLLENLTIVHFDKSYIFTIAIPKINLK